MNKQVSNLESYDTLIFDCDGVILNSNDVKSDAFYQAALPYGEEAAQVFVEYHRNNGGVSRYRKFEYFLEFIAPNQKGPSKDELLKVYANKVAEGLMNCEVANGLHKLREITPNAGWMIVSGGDQKELREVFKARDLDMLFDQGIFGSPDSKVEILEREIKLGHIESSALFLGDSKYDYQVSQLNGLDFIFLSDWSEVKDWRVWVEDSQIQSVPSLNDLNRW